MLKALDAFKEVQYSCENRMDREIKQSQFMFSLIFDALITSSSDEVSKITVPYFYTIDLWIFMLYNDF